MMLPLKYVSDKVVERLFDGVPENLELYISGNFEKKAAEQGWGLELKQVTYDPEFPSKLDPNNSPETEIGNSLLVHSAIKGMTPAVARQERVWVRLCHLDCLEYSRKRWIRSNPDKDVANHFFAKTLDQCRDDNAIARLWWNGHIASRIDPSNPERVLKQVLARANIRLQFLDRSNASFRLPIAKGVVRLLEKEQWLHEHDRAFEVFMLVMDKHAGGLLFETLSEAEIDDMLAANLPAAKAEFKARYED
ncbi:hypothetical protein HUO14_14585 [Parasphingorhabdus flavimaris]|uniref:Uncharacterized protein n=1 Tax=Parasphingorhabdus flavimaris TaxID=266812 RepID=A0ABX2N607_9SPHN|nr:DUF6339 family protein [Parasphingorhabdus flavimaris]NVD29123.1 hypothetical protein [Parasphingorhabdus flavimaris]